MVKVQEAKNGRKYLKYKGKRYYFGKVVPNTQPKLLNWILRKVFERKKKIKKAIKAKLKSKLNPQKKAEIVRDQNSFLKSAAINKQIEDQSAVQSYINALRHHSALPPIAIANVPQPAQPTIREIVKLIDTRVRHHLNVGNPADLRIIPHDGVPGYLPPERHETKREASIKHDPNTLSDSDTELASYDPASGEHEAHYKARLAAKLLGQAKKKEAAIGSIIAHKDAETAEARREAEQAASEARVHKHINVENNHKAILAYLLSTNTPFKFWKDRINKVLPSFSVPKKKGKDAKPMPDAHLNPKTKKQMSKAAIARILLGYDKDTKLLTHVGKDTNLLKELDSLAKDDEPDPSTFNWDVPVAVKSVTSSASAPPAPKHEAATSPGAPPVEKHATDPEAFEDLDTPTVLTNTLNRIHPDASIEEQRMIVLQAQKDIEMRKAIAESVKSENKLNHMLRHYAPQPVASSSVMRDIIASPIKLALAAARNVSPFFLPAATPPSPPSLPKKSGSGAGLSNEQIDKFMKDDKEYLGTVSSDQIESVIVPKIKPNSTGSFIFNLDVSSGPGTHWVACYFTPHSIEYYNSLGDPPTESFKKSAKAIVNAIKPGGFLKLKHNSVIRQGDTDTCGYHAMKFIQDREAGKSYSEASGYSDHKHDDHVSGEKAVDKFIDKMHGSGFEFITGEGVVEKVKEVAGKVIKRVSDVLQGVRKRASPSIRKFMEANGEAKITKIVIGRQPVTPMIERVASLLSLGKFDKNKKELGYDRMLHLFMIISLDNGKTFKLEKNHVPEITMSSNAGSDTMSVQKPSNLTFNDFIKKAESKAGTPDKLWVYESATQNCQYFVKWTLQGAGVYNADINKFVMQDALAVYKGLSVFQKIAKKLTDASNVLDVVKEGEGKQSLRDKIKSRLKEKRLKNKCIE